MSAQNYVVSIKEIENDEKHGERVNQLIKLQKLEFLIPESFVIKAKTYFDFIKSNNLEKKINHMLAAVGLENATSFINKNLKEGEIPNQILNEILNSYKEFSGILNHSEMEIFFSDSAKNGIHKVKGDAALLDKIKEFWTSVYSPSQPKFNPTIIVRKIIKGKYGKIKTSSKQVRTSFSLSRNEIESLEILVNKLKKEFYFPYEIDFVIKKNKIYILKIKPETNFNIDTSDFKETNYKIIKNSNFTI